MTRIRKCAKCELKLDTSKGIILVVYPVFFKGEFLPYALCRRHFLEAELMNSTKFGKWVNEKVKKK